MGLLLPVTVSALQVWGSLRTTLFGLASAGNRLLHKTILVGTVMRNDIPIREVTEVGLALIPEKEPTHGEIWVAHLVNLKEHALKNVLVTVEGHGEVEGHPRKTATLRYLLPEVGPLSSQQIEILMPEVMAVANQFWISFTHKDYLYDKKFIVPSDAREVMELIGIPVLHCQGLWFD